MSASAYNERSAKRFMRNQVSAALDPGTGEVQVSVLVNLAEEEFELEDYDSGYFPSSDPSHELWAWAAEIAEEFEG